MTRKQLKVMLGWIRPPAGYRYCVSYPVSWKQYKKHYPKAKKKEFLDGWLATTDPVDKIIYIAPYYVSYFTPMTLFNTLVHEFGHTYQQSTKGGHHNRDWYLKASKCLFTLEDEYVSKDVIYDRINRAKDFNRRVKLFARTQKIKNGYYVPPKLRSK
ncbi:MAG: hypothetical protein ACREBR_04830 [bacterium]